MANRTLIYTTVDSKTLKDAAEYQLTLNADGSADLSALPAEIRTQWEVYGLTGRGYGHAHPKEGSIFFNILLARANAYFRVREVLA